MLGIYLFVRTDLHMGKGKMAGQCCHAVQGLLLKNDIDIIHKYISDGSAKIVLKIPSEEEMINLIRICVSKGHVFDVVTDAGKTQIEPGSRTVLGIGIVDRDVIKKYVEKYKLM
jgi:peptidyl-tRNA hydrolase, PTH2 family